MSGAAGSSDCPAGSARTANEAACRTAAATAGKTLQYVETSSAYPKGCYYSTSISSAYFNTDAVGAGSTGHRVLCAAIVTTGAPPTALGRSTSRVGLSISTRRRTAIFGLP
jgi:hypothetical protein